MKDTKLYPEILRRLAEPLFAQGETRVFVARCCDVVFVGVRTASSCKHCKKTPVNHECSSLEQVLAHADPA